MASFMLLSSCDIDSISYIFVWPSKTFLTPSLVYDWIQHTLSQCILFILFAPVLEYVLHESRGFYTLCSSAASRIPISRAGIIAWHVVGTQSYLPNKTWRDRRRLKLLLIVHPVALCFPSARMMRRRSRRRGPQSRLTRSCPCTAASFCPRFLKLTCK